MSFAHMIARLAPFASCIDEMWLVFGVLAFFLSFIPNIGLVIAVLLPMPIVALDPSFSTLDVALTFLVPAIVGTIAKDILEPWLLGNATSLHPVAVLLVILMFGRYAAATLSIQLLTSLFAPHVD
jgi:predicted PurR-regulated permease PerM